MAKKRLRVFAGPNGSGKSTLFDSFKDSYNPGIFINADDIEKELSEKGFIDLSRWKLALSQTHLEQFLKTPEIQSFIKKSVSEGHSVSIQIKDNIIIQPSKLSHSYEAAIIASFIRKNLLEQGISFSFETVMSHISKLDEVKKAKELGYKTYLYFICLDSPLLNISRVENRVSKGGHSVNPQKIVTRYSSTLDNLFSALELFDKAFIFDNSKEMLLIAETNNGELTLHLEEGNLPNWFPKYVLDKI